MSGVQSTRTYNSTMFSLSFIALTPNSTKGSQPQQQWQPHPHQQWQPWSSQSWQPPKDLAIATFPKNSSWLLNSGASHHVTTDLSNMSIHTPYDGTDDIIIGDRSSLPITHTGSTSLTTPSHTFSLQNVLCVPNMRKNLSLFLSFVNLMISLLNSYPLFIFFFLWRIYIQGQSFCRVGLKMVCMSG